MFDYFPGFKNEDFVKIYRTSQTMSNHYECTAFETLPNALLNHRVLFYIDAASGFIHDKNS